MSSILVGNNAACKDGNGVETLSAAGACRPLVTINRKRRSSLLEKEYERINSVHYDCGVKTHSSGAGASHIVKGTTCIDIGAKVT